MRGDHIGVLIFMLLLVSMCELVLFVMNIFEYYGGRRVVVGKESAGTFKLCFNMCWDFSMFLFYYCFFSHVSRRRKTGSVNALSV